MPLLPGSRLPLPLYLLCVIPILYACGGDADPAPPPPRIAIVESVQTEQSKPETLRFAGVVESVTTTELAFQVPGRVERILVDEGARVEKGQILAKLDATDYQLQFREAAARQKQLHADLERKRNLLAEGILSPAAIEPLEAGLIAAQVARDTAKRRIGYSTLTAPFAGVVAQRMAEPDTVVDAGTPILRMQDDQHIEVGVDLTENAALSLPLGPELQAEGQLLIGDVSLTLHYREHSTQPREGARTYRLILRGTPPDNYNLLPGMAVRVSLQRPASPERDKTDSYLIPLSALQTGADGEHFIWLAAQDQAKRQDVQLHSVHADQARVTGELQGENLVIVAGGDQLSEGQTVQIRRRN